MSHCYKCGDILTTGGQVSHTCSRTAPPAQSEPRFPRVNTEELLKRLPPRPKCSDCGLESLTGNVHEEDCVQMKPRDWTLTKKLIYEVSTAMFLQGDKIAYLNQGHMYLITSGGIWKRIITS